MDTELNYDFHDANLLYAVTNADERSVILSFDLYPLFYRDNPRVRIALRELFNFGKVSRYFDRVKAESDDEQISSRCNCFQFDSKKNSKAGDLYLFLDLEAFAQIRIHCKELKLEQL